MFKKVAFTERTLLMSVSVTFEFFEIGESNPLAPFLKF